MWLGAARHADCRVRVSAENLCEPAFERPLSDISFGHMLVTLFRTAGQFDMQVQPQLVLLQKTLLNIEGLAVSSIPSSTCGTPPNRFSSSGSRIAIRYKTSASGCSRMRPHCWRHYPCSPT